jgi:hypothetical protein
MDFRTGRGKTPIPPAYRKNWQRQDSDECPECPPSAPCPPATCTSRAWVRNPDWLDMPTVENGDEIIYLLVAVRENQPNFLSFVVNTSGVDYSVDLYNDGTTVTTHTDNTQADFDLDYTKGTDKIADEGYKQVIVKITCPGGTMVGFDLYRRHPNVQSAHPVEQKVLSIKLAGSFTTFNQICRTEANGAGNARNTMLEEFEFVGTSSVTTYTNSFKGVLRLGKMKGDFSAGTNFNTCWSGGVRDFDKSEMIMPSSGITNFSQPFISCFPTIWAGSWVPDFLKGVEYLSTSFSGGNLQIFGTDTYRARFDSLTNANGFYQAFQTNEELTQAYFDQTYTQPKSLFRAFRNDFALQIVDAIDASLVTNMTGTFEKNFSLSWLRLIGITVSFTLEDCNFSREGLVQVFNDLGTVASGTITVTNNPGVPDLTAADLLIATNKGWTVTT